MHEFGIAETTLRMVLDLMATNGASRIEGFTLRIGTLAAVDTGALRFAFDALLPGTPAAGAALTIETVEAQAACPDCGIEFPASRGFAFRCPRCGEWSGDLRQGRELDLARVTMV